MLGFLAAGELQRPGIDCAGIESNITNACARGPGSVWIIAARTPEPACFAFLAPRRDFPGLSSMPLHLNSFQPEYECCSQTNGCIFFAR